MPTDHDILTPLRDDDFGPASVDLPTAMRSGRRRILVRRTGAAAASVAGLVAITAAIPLGINALRASVPPSRPPSTTPPVASTIATPLSCKLTYLKSPDNVYMSAADGVSPNGRYLVGHSYVTGFVWQPVLWDNGRPHKAGPTGSDTDLTAVNDSGVAVGSSFIGFDTDSRYGVVWRDGQLTRLDAPDGFEPVAINASAEIVGAVTPHSGDYYPVVLDSPTATARRLPLPGNDRAGKAVGIDADGTIVGTVADSAGSEAFRAAVWKPDGSVQVLPVPTIPTITVQGFSATAIHNGVVIGSLNVKTSQFSYDVAATYDLNTQQFRVFTDIGPFNVRGATADLAMIDYPARIFTPSSGLQDLPQPETGLKGDAGVGGISADGRTIAGDVSDAHGIIRAVVWHCH